MSCFEIKLPLIPLRIIALLLTGGCSNAFAYIQLLLLQRNLSLNQITLIFSVALPIRIFAPVIFGALADKIGRYKPIFITILLVTLFILSSFLFLPHLGNRVSYQDFGTLQCNLETNRSAVPKFQRELSNNRSENNSDDQVLTTCKEINLICNKITNLYSLYNVTRNVFISSNENAFLKCKDNSIHSLAYYLNRFNESFEKECNMICQKVEGDSIVNTNTLIYIFYVLSVIFFYTFSVVALRIFDAIAISLAMANDSNYGRERVWIMLGAAIVPLLSSCIIYVTSEQGFENYESILFVSVVAFLCATAAAVKLNMPVYKPAEHMYKKLMQRCKNIHILIFLTAVSLLGTLRSFEKQFSNIYLKSLGGNSFIFGVRTALSYSSGIPFLMTSNYWLNRIGLKNVILIGFVGHTIFYFSYWLLKEVWWCLIIEFTAIVTHHLLWVAVVTHSYSIAPEGLVATLLATSGTLYFNAGSGLAGILANGLLDKYSNRATHLAMAVFAGIGGLFYALYISYFRYKKTKRTWIILLKL